MLVFPGCAGPDRPDRVSRGSQGLSAGSRSIRLERPPHGRVRPPPHFPRIRAESLSHLPPAAPRSSHLLERSLGLLDPHPLSGNCQHPAESQALHQRRQAHRHHGDPASRSGTGPAPGAPLFPGSHQRRPTRSHPHAQTGAQGLPARHHRRHGRLRGGDCGAADRRGAASGQDGHHLGLLLPVAGHRHCQAAGSSGGRPRQAQALVGEDYRVHGHSQAGARCAVVIPGSSAGSAGLLSIDLQAPPIGAGRRSHQRPGGCRRGGGATDRRGACFDLRDLADRRARDHHLPDLQRRAGSDPAPGPDAEAESRSV